MVPLLWVGHAVPFFAHEYAHSFVAWALGWKLSPLLLHVPAPVTLQVWLIQSGISQGVDEVPIFASGHGAQAALISAAGMVLGNGLITLPLSVWSVHEARQHEARLLALLAYWCVVASVGNLIDYVPLRTFVQGGDLDQDMYAVEQGLRWSPWTLLVVFGVPIAAVTVWFLFRFVPDTLRWVGAGSHGQRVLLAVLTAAAMFGFYGLAGWSGCGPAAHAMAKVTVLGMAPVMAIVMAFLVERRTVTRSSP